MTTQQLPTSIHGPDQLQAGIDELRALAGLLVQAGRRRAAGGNLAELPAVTAPTLSLLQLLPEKQRATAAAIEQLASELETLLHAATTIYVTTAAALPSDLKDALTDWFRSTVQPTILLSFHVDPGLSGGMTVRTLNHVHDFSFRTPLLANKMNFIKVLERV